ncbi:MAG: hypothetical protein LBT47_02285 [Deltaproteobacteria bacterium]|jgi:hypothetical protein|nr:hypothetical protein [Deltaproteobacteria bacterium]
MPKLGKTGLKILKTVHFITAGLWVGGAVGLNLIIFILAEGQSGGELYGYNVAAKLIDDLVIIPGAIGCLLTGLLFSLFSHWGFFKHRWVAVKWLLTVFCILFGTFYLGPKVNGQPLISISQGLAALTDPQYVANRLGNLRGGVVQVVLIVFMLYISVFKPWRSRSIKGAGD